MELKLEEWCDVILDDQGLGGRSVPSIDENSNSVVIHGHTLKTLLNTWGKEKEQQSVFRKLTDDKKFSSIDVQGESTIQIRSLKHLADDLRIYVDAKGGCYFHAKSFHKHLSSVEITVESGDVIAGYGSPLHVDKLVVTAHRGRVENFHVWKEATIEASPGGSVSIKKQPETVVQKSGDGHITCS